VSISSVLHKLVDELNRPHLHDEIDETDEQTAKRNEAPVSEMDQLKADIAKLQGASAPAVAAPIEPVKAEDDSETEGGNAEV
jgi:hypothetical protein